MNPGRGCGGSCQPPLPRAIAESRRGLALGGAALDRQQRLQVEAVVAFLREQGEPAYAEAVTEADSDDAAGAPLGLGAGDGGESGLYEQAVSVVARERKASTSFIQRHLNIGYNRAAKLVEQMEKEGVVGPANHIGKREVLIRRTADD